MGLKPGAVAMIQGGAGTVWPRLGVYRLQNVSCLCALGQEGLFIALLSIVKICFVFWFLCIQILFQLFDSDSKTSTNSCTES